MTTSDLTLAVLLLAVWAASWWRGTRRFRLWFALLAPVACVAGIILATIGSLSQADGSCFTSCDGGSVQRWAEEVDSPSAGVAWLGSNSVVALVLAVALTGITLIVDPILQALRDSREARSQREDGARSAVPNPDLGDAIDRAGVSRQ